IPSFEDLAEALRDKPNGFPSQEFGFRRLRGLLLAVCALLLGLLLASGIIAVHFLRDLYAQELSVRHALTERTQMLFGLWVSVQGYRQAVEQFVSETQAGREQVARQRLDKLTLRVDMELRRYPRQQDSEESALVRSIGDVFFQQRDFYTVLKSSPAKQ